MSVAGIERARPVLITGGAGFIGTNLADRLLRGGRRVIVFDNFARGSVRKNWEYLRGKYGARVELLRGDVRERAALDSAVQRAASVFHFAAQVAVTTSLLDPSFDFDVNVRGTLNVLEAIRALPAPIPLLFTSTNKVYGALDDVRLKNARARCVPSDAIALRGVSEQRSLDFHSPYGCSKGAADQYVRDYARSFGLPTVVFRMSCIYGPRQFGTEDQGWLAHFLLRAQRREPITIYGDGRQVRDVLFVEDLVDAMLLAQADAPALAGRVFNMGGGVKNTVSLRELLALIEEVVGERPRVRFATSRVGDQRYYVSATSAFRAATGWRARIGVRAGVERLASWTQSIAEDVELEDSAHGAAQ